MILVFGGTTEGRSAAATLEEAGSPFFYSTKGGEQDVPLHHGTALSGAMTAEQMAHFCRAQDIRLLVDAAHPYAAQLHASVASAARACGLPVVRYERRYPEHYDERIRWFATYADMVSHLLSPESLPSPERGAPESKALVLATTGVQSIHHLKPLEARYDMRYRILRRESSLALAREQGADERQLCFYGETSEAEVLKALRPVALLVKDSGASGGFSEKVEAALAMGIAVLALRRPPLPEGFITVDGPYGLRRQVEALLPSFFPLHSGLTTGTYATAAALAAARHLLRGEQSEQVVVTLPNGEHIPVPVTYGEGYAACIKVSGDDPDVTDGAEIRASVWREGDATVHRSDKYGALLTSLRCTEKAPTVHCRIIGGEGVGRFTLPGLDYPPGEAAINRVPREMIERNIGAQLQPREPLVVEISVPGGEALGRRTFNPRIGIVGGISIVGSSGVIMPFSNESFVRSIRRCIDVAVASGSERIVINSGAKSAQFVRTLYPQLPAQAFVEYGNFVGATLRMASEQGVARVSLCMMIGKASKVAAGYLDTHSRESAIDASLLATLAERAGVEATVVERIRSLTIARELWSLIPPARMGVFAEELLYLCRRVCAPLLPHGELTIHLIHPPLAAVYTSLP